MISVALAGVASTAKQLQKSQNDKVKALYTAIRVEGFRLARLMKQEIRTGAPGGKALTPLKEVTLKLLKRRNKKPLTPFAAPITYRALRAGDSFTVEVGYLDMGRRPLSAGMLYLIKLHQAGGSVPMGRELSGGKSGKRVTLPPRPIVQPFFDTHGRQAVQNIEANFLRKLKGERI